MSFGQSMPRMEDGRFLSGRACFVDDLQFPGMLHAVVVRSAQAHALVKRIGVEAVRKMPGVQAVYTFADIAKHDAVLPIRLGPLPGCERYRQRPLAHARGRSSGAA